jgi:hypothetical protein
MTHIEQRDGVLTRQAVFTEAENNKSPLHKYFTWDQKKAALAWNLREAEALIRSYYYTPVAGGPQIREYSYSPALGGYVNTERVRNDPTLAQDVALKLKAELDALITRNRNFAAICPSIRPILTSLEAVSSKIEAAALATAKKPAAKGNAAE